MIRISVDRQADSISLNVEGTLSDQWADELERCWLSETNGGSTESVTVNLLEVTFIDDKGRELLKRMISEGVRLKAAGVMTQAIIEEIKIRS